MRLLFAAWALSALLATGCARRSAPVEASAKEQAPEAVAVRVATAESRQLARTLSATGSLAADETVTISSEVAGRVAEMRVDFGQSVRQGEVIAELDKREFALQLERSRAALAQALARIGLDPSQEEAAPDSTPAIRLAKAQLEDACFKYENAARLVKTGDVSQERFIELEKMCHARQAAYDAARDELRTALANIRALRAEVKLAEKRLNDATVRAPFEGSISARLVSPGQYLKDNAPIATLVKTHPLRLRVEKGELKEAEKIGAAAAKVLVRNHGHRYFGWELRQGQFHYFEHPVNFARERACEGKYVIQTEEPDLSPVEAVAAYKQLNEVERGFAHLKGLLEVRPVFHHKDDRVRAHVFVAALAFLLDRALEKKLRAAKSSLSSPAAWQALETVRCVRVEVGARSRLCVTRGGRQAAEVLKILRLTELDPPKPPEGEETVM